MISRRSLRAVSLLELLIVVAIIGIIAVFAVPAVGALSRAQGVTRAAYDVAGLLEFARSEAVARQTYVWVGFEMTESGGTREVSMGAVASRDGSGTNTAAANLVPITRLARARNAALIGWSELSSGIRDSAPTPAPTSLSTNSGGITFQLAAQDFSSGRTLTFTPRGECLLTGSVGMYDGYEPSIALGLRQTHGTTVAGDENDAAVLVDGPTGSITTLRIQ